MKKQINLHDLQPGPIQHATLPPDLIDRIKAYKQVLGEADQSSLEEAIDSFRRDLNPEKEVAIWERMALVYKNFTAGHRLSRPQRHEVLRVLLLLSTGAELPEKSPVLSRDQLLELRYNF